MIFRRKASYMPFFALLLALATLFSACPAMADGTAGVLAPVVAYDPAHPEQLTPDQLYCASAILIDRDTGRVLYEKNPDQRLSPASTTKIMTLMLAIEHGRANDMFETFVTVPPEAAKIPADSSVTGIRVDEKIVYLDLLYGFMLLSGNDAGNAIAVIVAGSVDEFVRLMNDRAAALGCVNTRFANAHGYTDENHLTTARDLATISREAMKDDLFREIVSTGTYTMPATNKQGGRTITNTNAFATGITGNRYKFANGIKTGFTSAAGHCFVGSATDDRGVGLISVVLNATATNSEAKWIDSRRLLEYGFASYKQYAFNDLYNRAPLTVALKNPSATDPDGGMVQLNAVLNRATNFRVMLSDDQLDEALVQFQNSIEVEYTHPLRAPVEQGAILGTLTYQPPGGGNAVTAILTAARTVEAEPAPFSWESIANLFEVVPVWMVAVTILLFIVLISVTLGQAVSRRRRRKERERRRREMAAARRNARY